MAPLDVSLWALLSGALSVLVLALLARPAYRRYARSGDDAERRRSDEKSEGPLLSSWRYVYDVDNAEREIASVQEQAEELATADEKARR